MRYPREKRGLSKALPIKGRGEVIFPPLVSDDQDGTRWDTLLTPEPAD